MMTRERQAKRAMRCDWVMSYVNLNGKLEVCFIREGGQHWYKPTDPSIGRLYDVLNAMSVSKQGHYNMSRRSGWSFWIDLPR